MLSITAADPKARAEIEDNFRKTTGQLIGGAVVLIGAGVGATFTYLQFSQQQQASHELLISTQVSKGFEQLGSNKPVVQLGGIYALGGVMKTSEQYHRPVLEALCAFVRDRTKTDSGDGPPVTEIQAALTVIGSRALDSSRPDFANAHMPKALLRLANLRRANLAGANLTGADLYNALLDGANLAGANLTGAKLMGANLNDAILDDANLTGAKLFEASLTGAHFLIISADPHGANLTGADLTLANLTGAILLGANLNGATLSLANLAGANLAGADLNGAKLRGANLNDTDLAHVNLNDADLSGVKNITQAQLDKACGTNVKLDPGLTLKPCFFH